jgi:CHAD domain-containing protein
VVLHTEPIDGDRPPEVLVGVLRGANVSAAVTVRVRRRTWAVRVARPAATPEPVVAPTPEGDAADGSTPDGEPPAAAAEPSRSPLHATVVLEDLALLTGRRVSARRAVVHLDGDTELVRRLSARFEAAGAEELDDPTPVLDLLGGRVRRPVVPGEPGSTLDSDASAGQVVALAVARAVARLLANDLAIRLDLGPEGVHQARVSTRRLRSDLKTFAGLLDPEWSATIGVELKWLAAALGEVRDADVLGERLSARVAALDPLDQDAAMWLLDEVTAERSAAGAALEVVMASERYLGLLDALVAAANHPPLTAAATAEAADTFDDLARRAWKPLRKAARRVTGADDPLDVPVEEIHAVRIRAKRFRYAADAAAPVDPAAAKHASALAVLQDELGELNDAAVAEAWLRARLPAADAAQSFVIGQLVAAERAEIATRRATWVGPWRSVNRRKRRAWLSR